MLFGVPKNRSVNLMALFVHNCITNRVMRTCRFREVKQIVLVAKKGGFVDGCDTK